MNHDQHPNNSVLTRELRDSLSELAAPERPPLAAIISRGRDRAPAGARATRHPGSGQNQHLLHVRPVSDGVLSVNPPVQPKPGPGFVPAPSGFADGPQVWQPGHPSKVFPPDAHTQTVINPAAMHAGTELFFGYAPGDNVVFEDLIYAHSYSCSSQPPPGGPKRH